MKKLLIGLTLFSSMSWVSYAKDASDYTQVVLATCTSSEGAITFFANEGEFETVTVLMGSIDNNPANVSLMLDAKMTFVSNNEVKISHPKVQANFVINYETGAGEITNINFSNDADKLMKCEIINL